ncbi:MAG TPA: signal peptidase I [Waterburya sp.]|jgi:signal peptidase I
MLQFKNNAAALVLGLSLLFECTPRALADPTLDEPKPSQSQCLELVIKLAGGTPSDAAQLEPDRALMQRCRELVRTLRDPNAPLPTATECINVMQLTLEALHQNNVGKLENISAEQGRSLTRCPEIIETRYIPSRSMLPTLQINDRLLIDKTVYRSQLPRRGDLVLFQPTEVLRQQNFKEVFLKRIIGLPGEKLSVKNGLVYINGKPLQENYIEERPQYEFGPVVVPANQYFVLGDNRNNSYDSHYWGFVPRELIVGKAIGIFCPVERQQILDDSKLLSNDKKAALSALFRSSASVCTITPDGQRYDRQSEGKTNVSAMNRAQQAFYLEKERFTSNLHDLGLGIQTETKNYRYSIIVSDEKRMVQNMAIAKVPGLKSYIGITTLSKTSVTNESMTSGVICESEQPTTAIPAKVSLPAHEMPNPTCPAGYSLIR